MSLTAWTWDPAVLVGVGLAAAVYWRGWLKLKRRGGHPKNWQLACFLSGLALVLVSLESPIGTYDQQLFVMHMTEHILLTLAAAPLLLLGAPLVPLLWGLPDQERRGAGRLIKPHSTLHRLGATLTRPFVSLTIFVVVFAVWHIPSLYDLAQGHTTVHYLEHILFFASAILFWWPVIHPSGGARTLSLVASTLYFAGPMFEGTLIGALLTFAPRPLYATYLLAPRISGLSPLDDQQLAGLIMWIPSGLVYAGTVLYLISLALRDEDGMGSAAPATGAE
jgi:cytochrome c oxidase assembly factor CtaG